MLLVPGPLLKSKDSGIGGSSGVQGKKKAKGAMEDDLLGKVFATYS